MELFPAIDLRGGRCVRLLRGDFGAETVYDVDPVARARDFAAAGAGWLHVVDLDAARTGEPAHLETLAAIRRAVDCRIQVGGGVRSVAAAARLFEAGADRVVVGTAAVEDPELVSVLVSRYPGRVAVALDVRAGSGRWELAVRGWREGTGVEVGELVGRFGGAGGAAVGAVVVTAIERDGTLEGPDLELLASVLARCEADVVASGGVGSLDDIRALAGLEAGGRRLAGVIVGRALYEGRFEVDEAVRACSQSV